MSKRRSKRASNIESGRSNADAFVLMSDILDKLHIIDYERTFLSDHSFISLTPGYFAYSTNIAEQSAYFQSLCAWLFKFLDHPFMEWDDFQDPNSISNNILQECKKLKLNREFPSTKLRQGSGQETCEILDFLTNLAIKKINFKIKPPVFHKPQHTTIDSGADLQNEDERVTAKVDELSDDDSDLENSDLNRDENVDHSNHQPLKKKNYFLSHDQNEDDSIGDHLDDENEHKTTMSVMETSISSKAWELEVETVCHLLENRYITGINEWVTHLKKSKHHGKGLQEIWPDSKAKLTKYAHKLSLYLERIEGKETHLNREFSALSEEYTMKYNKLQELNKEYNDRITEMATLTQNVQETMERINEIKIEMENRNNTMTDMTPIRRLKETHNRLKKELIDLDRKIGLTRAFLNHSRKKHREGKS